MYYLNIPNLKILLEINVYRVVKKPNKTVLTANIWKNYLGFCSFLLWNTFQKYLNIQSDLLEK